MASNSSSKNFKINDRVRRAAGLGCCGIVKDVRSEVTASSAEAREKSLLVQVLWDNGTLSYFSPESLELAPVK